MHLVLSALIVLGCVTSEVLANPAGVVLNYRLQPNRDLTVESVTDAITTMRVLEDRGIVEKSGGRLSARLTSIHIKGVQSFRYLTGAVQPDQSFSVDMRYLDKATFLKGPDGQEQLLPDKTPLKGVRVTATVERDGKLRDGSVVVSGVEPALAEPLRLTMASVLNQATSIQPIVLDPSQSVPQEMAMQIPLPGLAPLDIRVRISNRLLAVEAGVARVQQVYSLDFGTPKGAMKIAAEGTGGGTMLYEVASQTLLSNEAGMLMKMTLDAADGVIEVEMNTKQSQTTRPTTPAGH